MGKKANFSPKIEPSILKSTFNTQIYRFFAPYPFVKILPMKNYLFADISNSTI